MYTAATADVQYLCSSKSNLATKKGVTLSQTVKERERLRNQATKKVLLNNICAKLKDRSRYSDGGNLAKNRSWTCFRCTP